MTETGAKHLVYWKKNEEKEELWNERKEFIEEKPSYIDFYSWMNFILYLNFYKFHEAN